MATIVRYNDEYRPTNWYPSRIISPSRPSACCFSEMDEIGEPEQEGRWALRYRRCRRCGFTVRLVFEETPVPRDRLNASPS